MLVDGARLHIRNTAIQNLEEKGSEFIMEQPKMKLKHLALGILIMTTIGAITAGTIYYIDHQECSTTHECLSKCGCEILKECNTEVSTDKMGEAISNFAFNGTCG